MALQKNNRTCVYECVGVRVDRHAGSSLLSDMPTISATSLLTINMTCVQYHVDASCKSGVGWKLAMLCKTPQ
jgi:hypothetical protein